MWTVFKVQEIRLQVESPLSSKYDKKIDCFSSTPRERKKGPTEAGTEWEVIGECVRKYYGYYVFKTGHFRYLEVIPIPLDYTQDIFLAPTHPHTRPNLSVKYCSVDFICKLSTRSWHEELMPSRRKSDDRSAAWLRELEKLRCSQDRGSEGSFSLCLLN